MKEFTIAELQISLKCAKLIQLECNESKTVSVKSEGGNYEQNQNHL